MLQNKEGTLIGLGCIALGCLAYFYQNSRREGQIYNQKKRQTIECLKESKNNNYMIDYQKLKAKQQKKLVFIQYANIKELNESAYCYFVRQSETKNHKQNYFDRDSFVENQSGGKFVINDFKNQVQNIEVQLMDFHIDSKLLQQKRQKTIVFKENYSKQHNFQSLFFRINPNCKIALLGTLGYSLTQNKFIFESNILALASQSAPQRLINFWRQKMYPCQFKEIIIGTIMGITFYTLIISPILSFFRRYKQKFKEVSETDLQFFKEKTKYTAKGTSALLCQNCKTNNVSLVYDCGHLCICYDCHQKQINPKCPLCGKVPKKILKVFL